MDTNQTLPDDKSLMNTGVVISVRGRVVDIVFDGHLPPIAYRAEVAAVRPATDYTARLIPYHDDVAVPLEETHILWQR